MLPGFLDLRGILILQKLESKFGEELRGRKGFDTKLKHYVIFRPIPDDVPYIQMRALGTLAGSFVVPLGYLTIRDAGHSRIAAILTALAICFGKSNR